MTMDNNELNPNDILRYHGGVFADIMESPDNSEEIELIKISPYYSPDNMPGYIKKKVPFVSRGNRPTVHCTFDTAPFKGFRFPQEIRNHSEICTRFTNDVNDHCLKV